MKRPGGPAAAEALPLSDLAPPDRPRARAFAGRLETEGGALLAGPARWLATRRRAAFWNEAERRLAICQVVGGSPLRSLLEYTLANLRAQARFTRTGEYTFADYERALHEIYNCPAVMDGYYLEGLLLTHAFWPVHFDLLAFFREAFLPLVAERTHGAEVGYGPGHWVLELLERRTGTTAAGWDVSPSAQVFAWRVLHAAGVDSGRYELGLGDAREPLPAADASCDWLVCAELLEHLPDPAVLLAELRRILRPGKPLFVTTAVDCNALDHLHRFADVEEVRALCREAGLALHAERALRVRDYHPGSRDPAVDLGLVLVAD